MAVADYISNQVQIAIPGVGSVGKSAKGLNASRLTTMLLMVNNSTCVCGCCRIRNKTHVSYQIEYFIEIRKNSFCCDVVLHQEDFFLDID